MNDIQKVFKDRGVTRLCHITTTDNLLEILKDDSGILANDFIAATKLHRNDENRWDNRTDYISLSIQYPNFWYLKNKKVEPKSDWCVIFINPSICNDYNTLFCPFNAAVECGRHLKSGVEALKACFDNEVKNPRRESSNVRTEKMLSCCPTDDQAEVMFFKKIPVTEFKGIVFESEKVMEKFMAKARKYRIIYPDLYIVPGFFSNPKEISNMIREGKLQKGKIIKK